LSGALCEISPRAILNLAAGAVILPAVSGVAKAQVYPTKPVRIAVGYAAGGGTDIVARLIGQWLSERLGQQFVISGTVAPDRTTGRTPLPSV
jgi:tripartite-type tricarboxylate transporter receptor subunit TctC